MNRMFLWGKRKIAFGLVTGILAGILAIVPASGENSEVLYGDLNQDGMINSIDMAFMKRHILGINQLSEDSVKNADLNGDVSVDSTDYSLIKRYVLEQISQFPVQEVLYKDPTISVDLRVKDLLQRMTMEEKIGQMVQGERSRCSPQDVSEFYLGSLLSGGGSAPVDNTPEGWVDMCKEFQDAATSTRLGIPIIYGVDAVHGHNNLYGATIFPHNIALGAANNPELMKEIAAVTGEEIIATGANWNFGPCVAVTRDDRWGRAYESFGENTELVRKLSIPYMTTLQDYGITATAKHFVADAGTLGGVDQGDAILDEEELRRVHLPVYKDMVDNGVKTVMISFSSWNGLKNHENEYLINDVLKGELKFEGFVVSDWEAIHQLSGETLDQKVINCVNAGVDMLMEPIHWWEIVQILKRATASGEISEERINDAISRILRVKFEMGLFEKPLGDNTLITCEVRSEKNREVAKRAVRESLVLLKNNGVLPLKKNAKIFITGPGADNTGVQSGGWTKTWKGGYDNAWDRFIPGASILDGFKKIAQSNGGEIITDPDFASEGDVALIVLGEKPYVETLGDENDLGIFSGETSLPDNMKAFMDAKASGLPIVTVILSGRPRIITEQLQDWDALVEAWLPGSEGDGVAEVLYGDYDFKGKLPVTWPKSIEQIPLNEDDMKGVEPLFPYGYGLKMFE